MFAHKEEALSDRYSAVRRFTERLCAPLEIEDYVIQAMADVSPAKWHLAHTTWFFETFVLGPSALAYRPFDPDFAALFNSYYVQAGPRWSRPHRGLLSRPGVVRIYEYRHHVDAAMAELLASDEAQAAAAAVELGLNHEQQHQELLLTDMKYNLWVNPLRPAYRTDPEPAAPPAAPRPVAFLPFEEAIRWIGTAAEGFFYDNEGPSHRELVPAFELADRLVTNGEYREFVEDGGYGRAELWLSDGWEAARANGWQAPLYWEREDAGAPWQTFGLRGMAPLDPAEPAAHVSFYEADAYARWRGAALPSEAQWESAAAKIPVAGNFVESDFLRPLAAGPASGDAPGQMYGDLWEWTSSPYTPYPGYRPAAGALGEYNGKFMCNQMTLRGGSCATSVTHIRPTYRNFFPPQSRWQFSGIRLATSLA